MGKTWEKSRIISRTYRGDTLYLSKTENSCYITLATDRSLGHEYYSTFKSSDLKTWKQLSGKVLNEKRDIIFLSDETAYIGAGTDEQGNPLVYKICLRIMTENLNNDEESRLIERLILGEEKAFCKLYVQYKPRLFKFAIALLKSQNVAEDICQDIFFNIWENRYFLKCGTSFSSFLFSMARNRIINYLRDESCHKRILESLYEQAIDFHNSTKNFDTHKKVEKKVEISME